MGPRNDSYPQIGKAYVLADSMLRLGALGLYYDPDFKDCQQEFSPPFEPLPTVEEATCTPIEVNEIFIEPNIEQTGAKL